MCVCIFGGGGGGSGGGGGGFRVYATLGRLRYQRFKVKLSEVKALPKLRRKSLSQDPILFDSIKDPRSHIPSGAY